MSINAYKNMLQNILYPTQKEQLDENVEEVEKEIIAEKFTKDSDDKESDDKDDKDSDDKDSDDKDTKPAIAENTDVKTKNRREAIRSIFANVNEAYDWKAAAKIEYERQRKEAHAKGEKLKGNMPSPERYHRSNMNSGMSAETAIKRAPTTTAKERNERNEKRNYTKD